MTCNLTLKIILRQVYMQLTACFNCILFCELSLLCFWVLRILPIKEFSKGSLQLRNLIPEVITKIHILYTKVSN